MQRCNDSSGPALRGFLIKIALWVTLAMLAACSGGGGGGATAVPVAAPDAYVFDSTTPLAVPVPGILTNDSGGTLTVTLVSGPIHAAPGSFALNSNGSFTYTHDGSGLADSFTYRATNGSASSNVATVSLTQNQPPVASNACLNTPRGIATGGFVSVTDEGGPLTYELVNGGGATKGNVTLNTATGQFTYTPCSTPVSSCTAATPGTGFMGMDKFTFRALDQFGLPSATATVTVLIDGAVRIMPLGDSITAGVYTSTTPDPSLKIGYRYQLYDQLEALSPNYAVNFVGSESNGVSASIGDPHHEGHGGFCAGPNGSNPSECSKVNADTSLKNNLADNVIAWLDANPADIILLHAGTNAFITSASDMDILLDRIETWQATHYPITVFVARIIADVDAPLLDVQTFNNNVAAMIAGRANVRYVIVNQQTGAGINYTIGAADGNPTGSDMADDLHPNQDGYNKMAAKWLSEMTNPANVGPRFVGLPRCP